MKKLLTFSFIGGDLRQLYVVLALAESGFNIRVYGFPKDSKKWNDNIYVADSVKDCTSGADVIVLPLPYSQDTSMPFDKKRINAPLFEKEIYIKEVIKYTNKKAVVFAGKIDDEFNENCKKHRLEIIDYSEREELAIMNAVPTVEGALEIAMANTEFTLHNSRCLVIGYGRIGKILSADLKGLGARVTATARKYSDLALIVANNLDGKNTCELDKIVGDYDVIFNTVPQKVLDFNILSRTRKDVLIVDLASKPGGVDFDVAKELGRQVIWALSLPGKVAPLTAGHIIKDTLMNILEELEV